MSKLRLAAVSYTNTKPFLNGFRLTGFEKSIDLRIVPPAECSELLFRDEVDVALCPVAALVKMEAYHIIGDFCIGCSGPVRTVAVYSHQPLKNLKTLRLDPQSRTSNILVQLMDSKYWKIGLEFLHPGDRMSIPAEEVAQLCIGDRCFHMEKKYPFRTDLGAEWLKYTGLPFVFALWVSKVQLPAKFTDSLNHACRVGIEAIENTTFGSTGLTHEELLAYLTMNIDYSFNQEKRFALQQFLKDIELLDLAADHDLIKNSSRKPLQPKD